MKTLILRSSHLAPAFERVRERNRQTLAWLPYPAVIVIYLSMLLAIQILPSLNPRIGSPASLLQYGSHTAPEGAFWFSLTPINGQLVALTSDRQVFRWPLDSQDLADLAAFRQHLRQHVASVKMSAGLAVDDAMVPSMVMIAADETLSYFHIRPVLTILAEAGFARYGFETYRASGSGSASVTANHHD